MNMRPGHGQGRCWWFSHWWVRSPLGVRKRCARCGQRVYLDGFHPGHTGTPLRVWVRGWGEDLTRSRALSLWQELRRFGWWQPTGRKARRSSDQTGA